MGGALTLLLLLVGVGVGIACELYLAPSKLPHAGKGIFAGRDYEEDKELHRGPVLLVLLSHVRNWQLRHYVYATTAHPLHLVVAFGASMFFNHGARPNTPHSYVGTGPWDLPIQQTHPFLVTDDQVYFTSGPVGAGEELYTSYGATWFRARGLPQPTHLQPAAYSIDELQERGVCLSDIFAWDSDLLPDERGVFAVRRFGAGERVTVSPALTLPRAEVLAASAEYGVLANYVLTSSLSDVALLPISLIGLVNHGGREHNLRLEFFRWDGESSYPTPDELLNRTNAAVHLAYYAVRPIEPGEELTIDYGAAWEAGWAKVSRMQCALECSLPYDVRVPGHRFLSPIEILDDLYTEIGWV